MTDLDKLINALTEWIDDEVLLEPGWFLRDDEVERMREIIVSHIDIDPPLPKILPEPACEDCGARGMHFCPGKPTPQKTYSKAEFHEPFGWRHDGDNAADRYFGGVTSD